MTDAHKQKITLRFIECWPSHEPRKKDPNYHYFREAKARLKRQGLLKCVVDAPFHHGPIELHHSKVEFAHINDVDVDKFNELYGLHLTDKEFQIYIESEGNLEPLCLPKGELILTANRGEIRIEDILRGDKIIGADGNVYKIKSLLKRKYKGEIIQINNTWLTPDHPVLTSMGWLPAGFIGVGDKIGQYIRMFSEQMSDMVFIEPQVLRSIVASDVVNVMHSFGGIKGPTQFLFHNPSIFKDSFSFSTLPHKSPNISLGGFMTSIKNTIGSAITRRFLQGDEAAFIGTKSMILRSPSSFDNQSTLLTSNSLTVNAHTILAPNRRTMTGAGGVIMSESGSDKKDSFTHDTEFLNTFGSFNAIWGSVNHVDKKYYSGDVYDIEIQDFPSFISGGLILHNCSEHHRGVHGVHNLTEPLWRVVRVAKDSHDVVQRAPN